MLHHSLDDKKAGTLRFTKARGKRKRKSVLFIKQPSHLQLETRTFEYQTSQVLRECLANPPSLFPLYVSEADVPMRAFVGLFCRSTLFWIDVTMLPNRLSFHPLLSPRLYIPIWIWPRSADRIWVPVSFVDQDKKLSVDLGF